MKVKDIMTADVKTVNADTPVKEVAGKLFDNALTGMPVVSGDEVIGIVTEGDVVMENANVHIPSYIN
ncbi:CBS domain-containing protein, partial [Patescibacteria group bacterium]|nr:CBS domain-containing protein [Patescibacteria group bacterium]